MFKSRADSDQNATGQVWYGLTEAADFQVVTGEISGADAEAPRTLFGTKFVLSSMTAWLWRVRRQERVRLDICEALPFTTVGGAIQTFCCNLIVIDY